MIDSAELTLKLFAGFVFSREDLVLSETRFDLVLAVGIEGVIDSDLGRSGSFKLDASIELYFLESDFVIETDAVFACFELPLAELLLEDFVSFDEVVGVIVVVVIVNELLSRFCCNPNRFAFVLLL